MGKISEYDKGNKWASSSSVKAFDTTAAWHFLQVLYCSIFPGRVCWFDGVFCLCLKGLGKKKNSLFSNCRSESSHDLEESWRVCACLHDHVFPFPASIAIRAVGLP